MHSDDESVMGAPGPERDKVGYGRPPLNGRFQKGQSGNPKGRPKGSANVATVLARTLREKVVINENGRRRTVTKLEASFKQLVNKSASGDLHAIRLLAELARESEAKQNSSEVQEPGLSELDHEVLQSIFERLQASASQSDQSASQAEKPNETDHR